MRNSTQILIVMIAYMALLISWGIYQGRKVKTSSDYAIAGRSLPGWMAALSERATGESSWALLGFPGLAYAAGLTGIWTAVGCVAGIITVWGTLAWRLRDEADKYEVTTFTDYLAKRHCETGKWIRVVASLTIVFFFFFMSAPNLSAAGKPSSLFFPLISKSEC